MNTIFSIKNLFRITCSWIFALILVLVFPLSSHAGKTKCTADNYNVISAGTCVMTGDDGNTHSIVGVTVDADDVCKDVSNIQLGFSIPTLDAFDAMSSLEYGLNANGYDVVMSKGKFKAPDTLKIDTAYDTLSTTYYAVFDGNADLSIDEFYIKAGTSLLLGQTPNGLPVTAERIDVRVSIEAGELVSRNDDGTITATTAVRLDYASPNGITSEDLMGYVRIDSGLDSVTLDAPAGVTLTAISSNTVRVDASAVLVGESAVVTVTGIEGTGLSASVSSSFTDFNLCDNFAMDVISVAQGDPVSITLSGGQSTEVSIASGEDLTVSYTLTAAGDTEATVGFVVTTVPGTITGPQDNISVTLVSQDGVRTDITSLCAGAEPGEGVATIDCPISLTANQEVSVELTVREVTNTSAAREAVATFSTTLSAGGFEARAEDIVVTVAAATRPFSLNTVGNTEVSIESGAGLTGEWTISSNISADANFVANLDLIAGTVSIDTDPQVFLVSADGIRTEITAACTFTDDGSTSGRMECPLTLSANEEIALSLTIPEIQNTSQQIEAVLTLNATIDAVNEKAEAQTVTVTVAAATVPATLTTVGETSVSIDSGGNAELEWNVRNVSGSTLDANFIVRANLEAGSVSILPDPEIFLVSADGVRIDITDICTIFDETDTSARTECPLTLSANEEFTISVTIREINNNSLQEEAVLTFSASIENDSFRSESDLVTVTVAAATEERFALELAANTVSVVANEFSQLSDFTVTNNTASVNRGTLEATIERVDGITIESSEFSVAYGDGRKVALDNCARLDLDDTIVLSCPLSIESTENFGVLNASLSAQVNSQRLDAVDMTITLSYIDEAQIRFESEPLTVSVEQDGCQERGCEIF